MWPLAIWGEKQVVDFIFTKTKLKIFSFFIFLFLSSVIFASQFEELDKPPEGAYKGQMILGGFFSFGYPYGDAIDAENDFVKENTYTFTDIQITKELLLTHLYYDFGIFFEYMPFDYVGVKSKLRRSVFVQRSAFGSNYQNWNGDLYSNYSLSMGPSFHFTNRKQWDVIFTPAIGYGIGKYEAMPVASQLDIAYTGGSRKRNVNSLFYELELALAVYFSGGFYMSMGAQWSYFTMGFSPTFDISQTVNGNSYEYMEGKSSSSLQSISVTISAGYAFLN
ncbi:MAG: hypothetical protein BWY23_00731 [Spirochaetes bacterium ADurb.Bin218]|jgi:hypothetical protein|nr:MAG: hypothetical protein BWY23_00731 [Spirochaetes bacterium ADurb.Bin218]